MTDRIVGMIAFAMFAITSMASHAAEAAAGRRVLAADYSGGKKRIAIVDPAAGKVLWEHKINDIHDVHVLPDGHVLFQTSWTKLIEVDCDGKTVWQYDAATANGNAGRKVEVHAFQRVGDGVTMIAESGPARIIEVDRDGKLLKEIKLQVEKPDPHRDTRNARKLENGNYLVAHESQGKVREYDAGGKVVWEYDAGKKIYSAVRIANGNTLIGTGDGHSAIEVSPEGKVVWSVTENELPGVKLAWVTQVSRLKNGNTLIVNCHAGPENPQIVEVTPDKKVAWQFKDFERFGNATPVAVVLDAAGKPVE